MTFDIEADGSIKFTPIVDYDCAVIAGSICALRLVLARPEDEPGTGSLVVQTGMTGEQALLLAEEIRKMGLGAVGEDLGRPN